jgi:hypothetical protein
MSAAHASIDATRKEVSSLLMFPFLNSCFLQIRVILNLPTLTPEEEKRAREEHRWIFENAT